MAFNVNSLNEAYIHLHHLSSKEELPTGDCQGEVIAAWLERVNEAVAYWNNNLPSDGVQINLHLQEIAFHNSSNRYETLLRRHNKHNAAYPNPPDFETDAEFVENVASWGHMEGAAVGNYIVGQHTFYLISAQSPSSFSKTWNEGWFNGTTSNKDEAEQMHKNSLTPFHSTALHAYEGRWHIFDSAYSNSRPLPDPHRRLSQISGLARQRQLCTLLRKRNRPPRSIDLGGGGNSGNIGTCRENACRWIVGEILNIMGDSSAQVAVPRWEALKPN